MPDFGASVVAWIAAGAAAAAASVTLGQILIFAAPATFDAYQSKPEELAE